MTLRHWSRVTPYTAPCGFAECYVFVKQSPEPLCNGPRAHGGACPPNPRGRLFSRSYEAGLPSSLTRFLPSTLVCSTCPPVSVCGTGRIGFETLRRFSRRHGQDPFPPGGPGGPRRGSDLRPARLDRLFHQPADLTFRVTPSLADPGPGMLTWRPSATRFRLALGSD